MTGRPSSATERALKRVRNGQTPNSAARAEQIARSTIYRAIKRLTDATPAQPGPMPEQAPECTPLPDSPP